MSARCPRLYLVTDRRNTGGRDLLDVVAEALAGGVDAVQLREKDLTTRELVELGRALNELCRPHRASLLINDRIDVALAIGAAGVHLPANSFPPRDARALLGPDALIGCSTHSLDEAQSVAGAANFVVFGPIFDTPSKRNLGAPLGLESLAGACKALRVPIVAIGGIEPRNVERVKGCGVAGVAVIRALLAAEDPRATAQVLRG
ncbi:MAG TPA: thiamine phosphate synthase [Candidatus Acidoferrales bacterium]|nr:thiamine phosphate synthase [Candidatus Acidoferrales bacterium]